MLFRGAEQRGLQPLMNVARAGRTPQGVFPKLRGGRSSRCLCQWHKLLEPARICRTVCIQGDQVCRETREAKGHFLALLEPVLCRLWAGHWL